MPSSGSIVQSGKRTCDLAYRSFGLLPFVWGQ